MMVARTSAAPETEPLYSVGPYLRVVSASLERIWENVLDWEHLPHLHADSFAAIHLVHSTADSWRALVTTVPSLGAAESEVEVVLDRSHLRYVTRTLGGAGIGTEIVTTLAPVNAHSTRIEVEFLVPGVSEEHADLVGVYYRKLYARLWDQDEAMMIERERVIGLASRAHLRFPDDRRAPVPLGNVGELRARLPLLIEVADRLYRIVEIDDRFVVHSAACPHMGGPLDRAAIDADACVVCPWHGYRFTVTTGRSADGRKLRLAAVPRVDIDAETGEALLRWRL
jgi:nitrite reductase/ring-hydroxylating ferredoxin subunit